MFKRNRTTRAGPAHVVLLLCATLIADVATAAPPTLQSVAVTPAATSLSVGQTLFFKATGTFSDGSTHVLGAAIADISPGELATCVLLTSGGVKCWGDNEFGQLGDGSTADSLVPRRVKGITKATAVAAPNTHGCALLASGGVQCWGNNEVGQLGNGTANAEPPYGRTVPVAVTGMNSATALAVGQNHSCALLAGGAVQCWGSNYWGTLGDGTNANSSVPVGVAGISTAIAIASKRLHSCALLASGAVQCWGWNFYGELGDGTQTASNTPVTVVGINNATAIAVGDFFSCALLASGAVRCWGVGDAGQLGDGRSEPYVNSSIPVSVALTGTAVAITAGRGHACAVMSSGAAQCWGYNHFGQLGNGLATPEFSNTPVRVSGISAPVRLAGGAMYTCALLADGAMRCWGSDNEGQLGDRRRTGDTARRWPVNVIGTPGVGWESSDPSKATIIPSGRATARSIGNATITATTAGFINDNAVLTVK